MPRLQLTDEEAALVQRRRDSLALERKGLVRALTICETYKVAYSEATEARRCMEELISEIETAIKELR